MEIPMYIGLYIGTSMHICKGANANCFHLNKNYLIPIEVPKAIRAKQFPVSLHCFSKEAATLEGAVIWRFH